MSITRRRFSRMVAAGMAAPALSFVARATAQPAADPPAKKPGAARRKALPPAGEGETARPRRVGEGARLGINLAGPADYNCELPFIDVFRFSREWISQQEGKGFGEGPKLELDAHGWVKKMPPGVRAESYLCTVPSVPSGQWTVLWDGKGEIEMWGPALQNQRKAGPKQLVFNTKRGGSEGFVLRLMKTDPSDPVRNIRVLMPGFSGSRLKDEPWNPRFLARWQGISCLRFMDFQATNNSKQEKWADRPQLDDVTWAERGVPLELMIDLANRLGADPWFCMPHLVDDDYAKQFAKMVNDKLDKNLKVYVEYANEVWNGMFGQAQYANQQGVKAKLANAVGMESNTRFYGQRATQMFRQFERAIEGKGRLVRVLGSQAANSYFADQICSFQGTGKRADALAIAPYISVNVHGEGNSEPRAADVANWTLDQLFDYVEKTALPECIEWMKANKKIADKHGLKLVAYEAGQHFVGVLGGENNHQVTRLLHQANRDPRMGDIYRRYYQAWASAGGDLICHFSSVAGYSKWGSWGLLESWDSDPRRSPKFVETMKWAKERGQEVTVPEV
ncbi:MAG: hypothetical protein ABW252_13270 [Polyangiales bacterium]